MDFEPARYAVFIHIPARNHTSRLGNYKKLVEAKRAIRSNEESRLHTFGGLLPANQDKVEYSIWRAFGWKLMERK